MTRSTNPAVVAQMALRGQMGGQKIPAKLFDGPYDATIIDTDVTNPQVPAGMCRIFLNSNPAIAYGPFLYHRVTAPLNGTPVTVEFVVPTANATDNSIQPRLGSIDDAYSVPPGTMVASTYFGPSTLVQFGLTSSMQALDPEVLTISFDIPPRLFVDVDINAGFRFDLQNGAEDPNAAVGLVLHGTNEQVGASVNIARDSLVVVGAPAELVENRYVRARIHIRDQPVGPIQLDLAAGAFLADGVKLMAQGHQGIPTNLVPSGSPVLIQAFASL